MARMPAISDADYEAIESAVMETARGRWFLAEYARRNRHSDTARVLEAIERLSLSLADTRQDDPAERVRMDILAMAKAIARTKAEIAAIKPTGADEGRIGEATGELDAIVDTTESATSDILHAAEQVQEIAWTLREQGIADAVCDMLDERATDIYTACSFQDLTGQRTRKVIDVLRYLERHVDRMIDIWGLEGAVAAPDEQGHPEGRRLANGPARPGTGLGQTDIDEMMGVAPVAVERALAEAAVDVLDIEVEEVAIEAVETRLILAPPDPAPSQSIPAVVVIAAGDVEADEVPFDLPDLRALADEMRKPPAAARPGTAEIEALTPAEKIALFA